MSESSIVTLQRDVEAIAIPSGESITLKKDMPVKITQALGGTFTVMTELGGLASINGKDADALGKEVPKEIRELEQASGKEPVDKLVWKQLRTCFDPEIPYNIVDLGLVYECKLTPLEQGDQKVYVQMTLTAPGCGMGEWLRQDIKNKLLTIPTVKEAEVDIVFDPPWDRSRMAEPLKRELGLL